MSRNKIFAVAATAAVLLGLVLGFHQAGSPSLQRLSHADEVRIEDINLISTLVRNHYAAYKKLPQSLAEFSGNPSLRLSDPETRVPYEYRALDEPRFELCAVFSTDNRADTHRSPIFRVHGAGHQCFVYPQ
jgi:hypothetical protein